MAITHRHHRFIIRDFWRKLIALCLALLVWKLVDLQLRSVVPVQQVRVKVNYNTHKFYLKEDSFLVDLEASTPSKMTQLAPSSSRSKSPCPRPTSTPASTISSYATATW